jgi:hypothetical protein
MPPNVSIADTPKPGATEKRTTPATEPVKRRLERFFTTNREDGEIRIRSSLNA